MAEIEIPFKRRFEKPMERGRKIRTWRTRKYGDPGDIFSNGSSTYKLVRVEPAPMRSVVEFYKEEGFLDKADAVRTLEEIFKENGYEPDRPGWAHWFEKVR